MAYGYEEFKRDIYKLTDIDLNLYKERQMKRRIESLIARRSFDGFESFYKGMKSDDVLLRTFVSYLTINVSQFYRNPVQWENLEKEIIPYLTKRYKGRLTIWSAACSTGDEPYTLAMLFSKHMSADRFRIIATDIDEDVLTFAENGVYPVKSLSDLPSEYRNSFFTQVDDRHYEIDKNLKKCIEFKKHNLLKDKYFTGVNLIVCRNVVIYFTDAAKDDVYRGFHNSLADDGILFIGSTEQILHAKSLGFESQRTFFYKKI